MIQDFEIFEKLNDMNEINEMKELTKTCNHSEIIDEKEFLVCLDCGEQIQRKMSSNFCFSDQFRVDQRKPYERNIYNDVKNMGFSLNIVSIGNAIYDSVSKGKILRGDSRKGVIFACIYYAYKLSENYQIPDELISIFGMEKKKCLKGLKYVHRRMKLVNNNPENDELLQTKKYINRMMSIFSATALEKEEIIMLWKKIKNKSSTLNRVRPQSLYGGLIYYWIVKKGSLKSI